MKTRKLNFMSFKIGLFFWIIRLCFQASAKGSEQAGEVELITPNQLSTFQDNCPDRLLSFENIQIQQSFLRGSNRCTLGIHPRDAYVTLIYRDYLIGSDGLLMVFNSFEGDEIAQKIFKAKDGAREFFFLPSDFNGFQWEVEVDQLVVKGLGNRVFKFSLKTAQISEISGAQIKVQEKVQPGNNGGVEITASNFSYVDAGFKFGDSPSYDKNKKSSLVNSQGKLCSVRNPKLYDYVDGSVFLKSTAELQAVVKASCPGFILVRREAYQRIGAVKIFASNGQVFGLIDGSLNSRAKQALRLGGVLLSSRYA